MDYIYNSWVVQIDITSVCKKHCIYCTRHLGHVSMQNRYTMNLDQVAQALDSLEGWPNVVGIMGGEPLLHPQFKEIVELAASRIPKERLQLWTSGLPNTPWENPRLVPDIANYFSHIHYNPHDATQLSVCRHQPLTIAVDEAVPDKGIMWKLINDCWLPRLWAPTIVSAGAYFCEVAGPLDAVLYGGKHAWKVEPGWWRRAPEAFQEQVTKLCPQCGMCLPMERQHLEESKEKFSPKLAKAFAEAGAIRIEEKSIEIFDGTFTKEQIIAAARDWYPTNYRDDLKADEALPKWEKGVQTCLEPDPAATDTFCLDTEEDFARALAGISQLPSPELPQEFAFYYKNWPFYPLREPYPFVMPNMPVENELYFRAMLLHYRQLVDDATFAALQAQKPTPQLLTELAHQYRQLVEDRYAAHVEALGQSLAGQEVYFWGYGAAWKHFGKYFAQTKARCFLADTSPCCDSQTVDGIPVMSPQELVRQNAPALPSVMFVRNGFVQWGDKVTAEYPSLLKGDLHIVRFKDI